MALDERADERLGESTSQSVTASGSVPVLAPVSAPVSEPLLGGEDKRDVFDQTTRVSRLRVAGRGSKCFRSVCWFRVLAWPY